jgi:hypothetical protein
MTDLPIEKIYDSKPNKLTQRRDSLIESLLCLTENAILFCLFPLVSYPSLLADSAVALPSLYHGFVLSRIVRIEKRVC